MNTAKVTETINYTYPAASRAGHYVVITRSMAATRTTTVTTLTEARTLAAAAELRATILTPRPTR
jgi:hypothetical protein